MAKSGGTMQSDRSSDEYELLSYLLNEHDIDTPAKKAIIAKNKPKEIPLSFAQQRLWFIDQFETSSNLYLIRRCYRITGHLNTNALVRTFSEIIKRHEILRTKFKIKDGIPFQTIFNETIQGINIVDLQHLPPEQRADEANEVITKEISRPFDLTTEVFRTKLIKFNQEEHWLMLIFHHIVFDGWSQKVFHNEIRALYDSFNHERPSPLAPLPIQYGDFTLWQQEWSKSNAFIENLQFWKHRLDGTSPLNLPTDFPRPPFQTYTGSSRNIQIPLEIINGLLEISRNEVVTHYMSFLAVFMVFLMRYTGQEDICVGTPISGRNRIETEKLIGLFINTLVLRIDLSGNPSFRNLLKRIKMDTLESYDHQDIPFEKIVAELNPVRDLSRPPIFQTMFIFEEEIPPTLELGNLVIEEIPFKIDIARYDLTLTLERTKNGINGNFKYNSDLFSSKTIERIAEQFLCLLSGIVENPDCKIGYLPLLPQKDLMNQIIQWNDTQEEFTNDLCINEIFERQVEKTPDSPAVIFNDQVLSFSKLNDLSNQLAYRLQVHCIGPEKLVGVCLEQNEEMIIGLMGIFKSGGGYVPIDSSYPNDLLNYIIQDSGLSAILTQENYAEKFNDCQIEIIIIGDDKGVTLPGKYKNSQIPSHPLNLAYAMYTSGSTGKPKGVAVQHKSLVNYLSWVNSSLFSINSPKLPTTTRVNFDASLKQLFAPLLRGDPVWIISKETSEDPHLLINLLKNEQNTGINCVPSYWSIILEIIENDGIIFPEGTLSYLLLGGEDIKEEIIEKTYNLIPHIDVWNLYGPTETTANASAAKINRKIEITIGRPISNTQTYILDQYLSPVPVGVPGYLYVGGDSIARGYINNPRLTAEKFIPNPFSIQPGSRMYHTGDRVIVHGDCNIKFLGRLDRQIKIRGFRVELGEIEAVLKKVNEIKDAFVLPTNEEGFEKELISYVITHPEYKIPIEKIRQEIKKHLPDYMVPSHFVFLEKFPLTPSGKMDINSLPIPDKKSLGISSHYKAPRSSLEKTIADIWSEVLKVGQVGIYDNFFDSGDHSLIAIMLVSRINKTLSVNLTLREFFQSPTIEELSLRVTQILRDQKD